MLIKKYAMYIVICHNWIKCLKINFYTLGTFLKSFFNLLQEYNLFYKKTKRTKN